MVKAVDDHSSRSALSHSVDVVLCIACTDADNLLFVPSEVHTAIIVVPSDAPLPVGHNKYAFARVMVLVNYSWFE